MKEWMDQTWWLYDLTVLAIFTLCIWNGWKRGIWRTIVGFLGYGAALVVALLLAQPTAEWAFDRWAAPFCTSLLTEKLTQYDLANTMQQTLSNYGISLDETLLQQITNQPSQASDLLYTALSQQTGLPLDTLRSNLSQTMQQAAEQTFSGIPDWMREALTDSQDPTQLENRAIEATALILSDNKEIAAETLTNEYLRPAFVPILKTFAFSVWFLLISLLFQGIIKGISRLRATGTGHQLDQMIGAAVGAVQGGLLIFLMTKITAWLVQYVPDTVGFFQTSVIDKTILFQVIYHMVQ